MRDQLLIITTILVVGTASAATFAFYQSPDKKLALLGQPAKESNLAQNNSQVAGVATQNISIDFPQDIPIFQPSSVVSSSKTMQSMQLTLETSETAFKAASFYKEALANEQWTQVGTASSGSTQTLTFSKSGRSLRVKISSSPDTKETIISLTSF